MGKSFLNGRVVLHPGNCLDVLAQLEECSVDSLCDRSAVSPDQHRASGLARIEGMAGHKRQSWWWRYVRIRARLSASWASNGTAATLRSAPRHGRAVYRVLKPGGHLIAMGGTRTYHRMACAIEDAGFEIRDTISWLYGSGFPKSHDVSKGIDRAAGAEREVVGNTSEISGRTIGLGTSDGYHGDICFRALPRYHRSRNRCRAAMGRLGHRAETRV